MRERTFAMVLWGVVILGGALTLAHLAYAVDAYQHCSIVRFIAGELW